MHILRCTNAHAVSWPISETQLVDRVPHVINLIAAAAAAAADVVVAALAVVVDVVHVPPLLLLLLLLLLLVAYSTQMPSGHWEKRAPFFVG